MNEKEIGCLEYGFMDIIPNEDPDDTDERYAQFVRKQLHNALDYRVRVLDACLMIKPR
jgi:hypothetical protein